MEDLNAGELVIRVNRSLVSLRLDWQGRSKAQNPKEIVGPFWQRVLVEASQGGSTIDMHFEDLEYFNSAMIATVIYLIKMARQAGVTLRIHYDAALSWQALSFEVIKRALGSLGEDPRSSVEFLALHQGENQQ